VHASIYLWDLFDKVVISDIDGTITKSDVFGHILPNVFGEDWTQPGCTHFYTNIKNNGYQILYLTARAIGQSEITKLYLQSVTQSENNREMRLPDGPVFMSPDRVLQSLKREVIHRNPEQFKVPCLKQIAKLFENPIFYAGFGNRESDRISYKEVGISPGRIFIIDQHGEIDNGGTIRMQTYSSLNEIVDQIFPSFSPNSTTLTHDDSFHDFKYWKSSNLGGTLEEIEYSISKKKS